jgi:hypothetical protein
MISGVIKEAKMKKLALVFWVGLAVSLVGALPVSAIGLTGWHYTEDLQKMGFTSTQTKPDGNNLLRFWVYNSAGKKISLLAIEDKQTGRLVKYNVTTDYGPLEEIALRAIQHGLIYLTLSTLPSHPPEDLMARDAAKIAKVIQARKQPRNVVQRFKCGAFECQLAYTDNDMAFVMALPGY